MNGLGDKELAIIDRWLSGQGRYKLFDSHRLNVLRELSGNEFKVWFALWVMELDGQESWPSISKLVEMTALSENTVIRVRKSLKAAGWVKETGRTAADKYTNPRRGAHTIKVLRVDDPTTDGASSSEFEGTTTEDTPDLSSDPQNLRPENLHPQSLYPPKSADNVSTVSPVSAFAVAVASEATPPTACTTGFNKPISPIDDSSLRSDETEKQKQKQPQQPTRSRSAAKWIARYGEPKPADFDNWSQIARSTWCLEHGSSAPARESPRPALSEEPADDLVRKPAPPTPPPPSSATPLARQIKHQCPKCDYGAKRGYLVAEHIENEHPEFGQQCFRVSCPETGCTWSVGWNKVDENEAERDADLLEHLEVDHDPTSPKYNPWERCAGCGLSFPRSENHQCSKKATSPFKESGH